MARHVGLQKWLPAITVSLRRSQNQIQALDVGFARHKVTPLAGLKMPITHDNVNFSSLQGEGEYSGFIDFDPPISIGGSIQECPSWLKNHGKI